MKSSERKEEEEEEDLGAVSRSVPKYLIVRSFYDNELFTLLTVRNVYITLGVPVSHK